MSIIDTSNYNAMIAQTVANSKGRASDLKVLSGGVLSDNQVSLIEQTVKNTIDEAIGFEVPQEVYSQVTDLMLGTSPGLTQQNLNSILQSTGVMGQITNKIPGVNIGNQLSSITTQYEQKLRQITGSIDGELRSLGLPGFAQNAANSVINDANNVINNVLKGNGITNAFGNQASVGGATTNLLSKVISGNGFASLDQIGSNLPSSITSLADGNGIIDLGKLTKADTNSLTGQILKSATGSESSTRDLGSLADVLEATMLGLTEETVLEVVGPAPYEIGFQDLLPGGQYISSIEELEAEMGGLTRDISEIIVHWSETFTNSNLTANQLTTITGSGDNAYHLIVKRDGSIERGVPLNSVGSHCPDNNHNAFSIGVCLVGGVNVSTGTTDIVQTTSPRSITRSQYNTLYQIFRTFFNQYPGGQALGHMDIDPSQEDPGFDVRDYVYNNFNKQSLYRDPSTEPALSPDDIISKQAGQQIGVTPQDLESFELIKDPDVLEKNF